MVILLRTGSVSETVCDRTAVGETETKQEEEVEGKCFRVPWRRLRHLSFAHLDPLFFPLGNLVVYACALGLAFPLVQLLSHSPPGISVLLLGVVKCTLCADKVTRV